MRVVVVGGGPAGFSAAIVARQVGAEVTVIERMDMLGGLGLVAGVTMIGSSEIPLAEEQALGGAYLHDIFESIATHKGIGPKEAPGSENVTTYNVTKLDSRLQNAFRERNIEFMLHKRVVDMEMSGQTAKAVILADGTKVQGEAFIDATGGATGLEGCQKFRGCVGCIMRCPTFGPLGGMIEKKVKTVSENPPKIGSSVLVPISSLSEEVQKELKKKGYVMWKGIPPNAKPDRERYNAVASRTLPGIGDDYVAQNLVIFDVGGFVKVWGVGSPLYAGSLRSFPGMEDAVVTMPTAGAIGQMMLDTSLALHDSSLKIDDLDNVFCAGVKCGPTGFLMDAIISGDLAGYNAVRKGLGKECLKLPKTLAVGAFIDHLAEAIRSEEGRSKRYGVNRADLMKKFGVYREKREDILKEVERAGLKGIYKTPMQ